MEYLVEITFKYYDLDYDYSLNDENNICKLYERNGKGMAVTVANVVANGVTNGVANGVTNGV